MRTPIKLAATAAVLVGLSMVATGGGTYAAFAGSTENTGNRFTAGTIDLADNDANTAMFPVTTAGMKPGEIRTGCIWVTYKGSIPAAVRLWGTTTASPLNTHLSLRVERGTPTNGTSGTAPATPAFSCSTFTPDAAVHVTGQPAGVVYTGALASLPTSYDNAGAAVPAATWAINESHSYRFTVTLSADAPDTVEGLFTTTDITWEARS